MTQEKMEEFRSYIAIAMNRGLAKVPPPPLSVAERRRLAHERKIRNQKARREAWKAEGKTVHGTTRKRPYQWLTGLTDQQKRERKVRIARERRHQLCPSTPQTKS